MSQDAKPDAGTFDLDRLQKLVELMDQFDLREVKLSKGEEKWHLRRGPQEIVTGVPAQYALPSAAIPAVPAAAAPAAAPPTGGDASAPSADAGLVPIKSPTVGTFYSSPSPGEKTFVKVGDRVSNDTVVCIVEAMKVFNQIPAALSGTIAKVLLADGDSVEFGQPLFMVKPD
ncbi:MAG: acetyl-CoA carboxylase biotin carboxyl carrier protein [Planctomycetaceae bacterium]|nr:acetyl-CoA carboxylase biotin carboxyl carrier protein [Planctomycetaceae bacterium]